MNDLRQHYKKMLTDYNGGLSNTSTSKFNDIVGYISKKFSIPKDEIYATGAGTRPGNLEVRLSQGVRATVHTTLGLGFIKDDKNTDENRQKLTQSAFVTVEKFLGRGKARYDNIAILIESENDLYPMGLIYKEGSTLAEKLISDFGFSTTKSIATPENDEPSAPVSLLEASIADFITAHDGDEITFEDAVKIYKEIYDASEKGRYIPDTNLFGILYAPHIVTYAKNGGHAISESVFGNDNNSMGDEIDRGVKIGEELRRHLPKSHVINTDKTNCPTNTESYNKYLRALRTKPFMLLAGISGTGKSRIVRELAFKSCPESLRDKDGTTPGNYLMVEVKPNWHDSSELLGYYSNIVPGYQFTKFIEFAVKATKNPNVPFFVCLDEMNLAPIEQYFAEFLSVLETRTKVGRSINSGTLVAGKYMKDYPIWGKEEPLTLPDNLFIIGTVNMDDTTHKFSRKVIDRSMTIEMNGGDFKSMFGHGSDLSYLPDAEVWSIDSFKAKYTTADEVLNTYSEQGEHLKSTLTSKLEAINTILEGTPFKISYRVLNELCIYLGVLLDDGEEVESAISTAIDQISLMKILPRIEGDEETFNIKGDTTNRLEKLMTELGEESDSGKKLDEMNRRLSAGGFTRFWP